MKALTICQPYAHLIMLPDDDDRAKRVENRTWPTTYRGPLLIHAGKSRAWLCADYSIPEADMAFGAIVGVCQLAGCVISSDGRELAAAYRKWPWLMVHEHAEPGYCWLVLRECRRFQEPIPYRGQQGLFDVPDEVVAEAIRSV